MSIRYPPPTCPHCGHDVELKATVTAWMDTPEWVFWGRPGARWVRCSMPYGKHFVVDIGGGVLQHRFATWSNDDEVQSKS